MLATLGSLSGLVITLAGLWFMPTSRSRRWLFLTGAVLLLLSSVAVAHSYFIALEILVVLGCALAFVRGRRPLKRVAMFGAGAAVLWWMAGESNGLAVLGGAGLVAVAFGFAINSPIWYALGSFVVATRSWVEFVAEPSLLPAVFGVLNLVFAIVCVAQLRAARQKSH